LARRSVATRGANVALINADHLKMRDHGASVFEGGKQSQGLCDSFASFAARAHAAGYPPNLTLKADVADR